VVHYGKHGSRQSRIFAAARGSIFLRSLTSLCESRPPQELDPDGPMG
jgi:hypothetical protein